LLGAIVSSGYFTDSVRNRLYSIARPALPFLGIHQLELDGIQIERLNRRDGLIYSFSCGLRLHDFLPFVDLNFRGTRAGVAFSLGLGQFPRIYNCQTWFLGVGF
jgi:hypothetical protein